MTSSLYALLEVGHKSSYIFLLCRDNFLIASDIVLYYPIVFLANCTDLFSHPLKMKVLQTLMECFEIFLFIYPQVECSLCLP